MTHWNGRFRSATSTTRAIRPSSKELARLQWGPRPTNGSCAMQAPPPIRPERCGRTLNRHPGQPVAPGAGLRDGDRAPAAGRSCPVPPTRRQARGQAADALGLRHGAGQHHPQPVRSDGAGALPAAATSSHRQSTGAAPISAKSLLGLDTPRHMRNDRTAARQRIAIDGRRVTAIRGYGVPP